MRSKETWRPTKYIMIDGQLRCDPTGAHVSIGSRIISDLVALHYHAALAKHARGRLLDLGCGSVPLFEAYRHLVDEVICVDWPNSLHKEQHIDILADLTAPLPLRDSCFDTILLSDVLEHIPNPEILVAEVARALRPGGKVVIGVPFMYWLHEVPHDFNRYTRYQIERLFNNAGLKIVDLKEAGGSPEVLADILSKMLAPRPRVSAAFVAIARWLLKRRFVQRISRKTCMTTPLEYFAVAKKPA